MRNLKRLAAVVLSLLPILLLGASSHAQDDAKPNVVAEGSKVSVEYTLTLNDGTVADSNVGEEALVYEQGKSQILPSLESALVGLAVGDSKKVDLSAEQGYGVVDPARFETVPANTLPEDARVAGTQLVAQAPNGQQIPVRVHEVKGEEIVIDLNHPLAGQALHFDIKILSID